MRVHACANCLQKVLVVVVVIVVVVIATVVGSVVNLLTTRLITLGSKPIALFLFCLVELIKLNCPMLPFRDNF